MNSVLINSTIHSASFAKKRNSLVRYWWILLISILIPLLIIKAIVLYVYYSRDSQQSTVTKRIRISPIHPSQHFYEEPISIILPPPIEISVYDHVRDNYV